MNKQMLLVIGLVVLLVLVVLIVLFRRPLPAPEPSIASPTDLPSEARAPEIRTLPIEPDKSDRTVDRSRAPDAPLDPPMGAADRTPFLESVAAEKLISELGYTQEDIVRAQRELRAMRYPEKVVNDPSAIMRLMKPRQLGSVSIEELQVPATAKTGEPISFTLIGTAPSPTFRFTHFDIQVQSEIIRLRARGNADGDNEAGPGGQLTLEGTIDPLPPGEYRVVIPELGPHGSFPIVVSE